MRNLLIVSLCFLSINISSEDSCLFDIESINSFRVNYINNNPLAHLADDKVTIIIKRDDREIHFRRGGCNHFGINISTKYSKALSEADFFNVILILTDEFASELIAAGRLKEMLYSKEYSTAKNAYYLRPYGETFFEAINHDDGRIEINIHQ